MLVNQVNRLVDNLLQNNQTSHIIGDIAKTAALVDVRHCVEFLSACGLAIAQNNNELELKTAKTTISDQTFCFVDIETNGPKANEYQIIEIAALLWQNGKVLDTMERLIFCSDVPDAIQEITGLTPQILKNGTNEIEALKDFKRFLGDAVFVAHNVGFDFGFIAKRMEKFGIGIILNRRLCTVELSKRTLYAPKYGLQALIEEFNLKIDVRHRALPDAVASKDIFELCIKALPSNIVSVEDLIKYSRVSQVLNKKEHE